MFVTCLPYSSTKRIFQLQAKTHSETIWTNPVGTFQSFILLDLFGISDPNEHSVLEILYSLDLSGHFFVDSPISFPFSASTF
jgi:hypothetical protein